MVRRREARGRLLADQKGAVSGKHDARDRPASAGNAAELSRGRTGRSGRRRVCLFPLQGPISGPAAALAACGFFKPTGVSWECLRDTDQSQRAYGPFSPLATILL